MTQKSMARLQRDAEEGKQNILTQAVAQAAKEKDGVVMSQDCWDSCERTYRGIQELLAKNMYILEYRKQPEILKHIPDPAAFAANIHILSKDTLSIVEEAKTIHTAHEGRSGGSDNPDEVIQTFNIQNAYAVLMERVDGVLMPVVSFLAEQLQVATVSYSYEKNGAIKSLDENGKPVIVIDEPTVQ